jgi:ATP-binding cassette subfamily C (CFTR/MRP) protein 4
VYVPRLAVFFCVLRAVPNGVRLSSQYIFGLTNLYENLKFTAVVRLPMAFIRFAEAKTSVERIQKFLHLDCHTRNNVFVPNRTSSRHDSLQEKPGLINFKNVTVKWDQAVAHNTLTDINFTANFGELVCLVGAAGSGKSTLIQTILNEIDLIEGTIDVDGSISYASQEPWIFAGTIRQNILFGQEFDSEKYTKVVKITALDYDLSLFSYGDATLVGEKGVMLSGGQKARINLARAIYKDADIYVLDDPFSAVDIHVTKQILNECIHSYLKGKCVVLVTHQLQYLQNVDKIYVLEHGKISKLVKSHQLSSMENEFVHSNRDLVHTHESKKEHKVPKEIKEPDSTPALQDYLNYFHMGASCVSGVLIIFLFTFVILLGYMIDYFVTFWVNVLQQKNFGAEFKQFFTTTNCLYVYAAFIVCLIFVSHFTSCVFVRYCKSVSAKTHNGLFSTVLYSTMKFFHGHSSGQILNRFSKDMGHIDEFIPNSLMEILVQLLMILGLTTIICILNYWMIVPTLVFFVIFYFCAVIFQPSNINIRRIEAHGKFYNLLCPVICLTFCS